MKTNVRYISPFLVFTIETNMFSIRYQLKPKKQFTTDI